MTTARNTASRGLVRIAVATLVAGGLLVGIAAVVTGSAAAYGAAVGTAIAVGIFGFGAFAVDAVAHVMPRASLLIAMLTYLTQVLLLALVFVAINGSGLLESTIDRHWLGGAIVLGAVVWMMVQVRVSMTARIPVYDLPDGVAAERSAHAVEGGAQ